MWCTYWTVLYPARRTVLLDNTHIVVPINDGKHWWLGIVQLKTPDGPSLWCIDSLIAHDKRYYDVQESAFLYWHEGGWPPPRRHHLPLAWHSQSIYFARNIFSQ